MSLKTVRRLASRISGVGESRVRIVDEKLAGEALSADDVRKLLREGALELLPEKGVGRAKARFKHKRLHAGRRRGTCSQKGSKALGKKNWIKRVRALRKALRAKKESVESSVYRQAYRRVKGGFFHSKKHLSSFIGGR